MSSAQIDIPVRAYKHPSGKWFVPEPIAEWLKEKGIEPDLRYCASGSWGDGYTNGVPNTEHSYILRNITEEDCLLFKIQFPECRIHYFE